MVVRFDLVRHHSSHKMDGGLHPLMFNSLVLIDKVSRITDGTRDTRVGGRLRGPLAIPARVNQAITTYSKKVGDPPELP